MVQSSLKSNSSNSGFFAQKQHFFTQYSTDGTINYINKRESVIDGSVQISFKHF